MSTHRVPRQRPERPLLTKLEALLFLALLVLSVAIVLLVRELREFSAAGAVPTQVPVATVQPTGPVPSLTAPALATATGESTALPGATTTPTPAATLTPTPLFATATAACSFDMSFVADVTIADDTLLSPGMSFVKTWRVRNSGTCAWGPGVSWVFADGDQMGGPDAVNVPATAPGDTADISVNLVAPSSPGQYTGYWSLWLPGGRVLDERYYVRIRVGSPTATPTRAAPLPTPVVVNWRGTYFNNVGLVGIPALVRDDTAIQFNWGNGSPAASVNPDNFSASWQRSLYFDGGTYRFFAFADDGVRVWVDNILLVDQWHNASAVTYQAELALGAGNHAVRVEYYENGGNAQIQFWWQRADVYPDWRGEYWSNRNLSGPSTLMRNDTAVNFNWGNGAPAATLPVDNFSARWTRSLNFGEGHYRFHARVDDGVRLYVDNHLVLDEWRDGARREVAATYWLAGGLHSLRVDYYDHGGQASAEVWWEQVASYPDWRGEYWSNRNLSGDPRLTRNDREVNFNWGFEAPTPALPADGFSARWTRQIDFAAGTYRFQAKADDGVRVYVDGRRVIDEWHDSSGDRTYRADVPLQGRHTVVVEYYDDHFSARVRFWYERTGNLPTATPTATNTPTPTNTPTNTPAPTNTPTSTPTPTNTPTATPTPPVVITRLPTPTPTACPTTTPSSLVTINELLSLPQSVDWNGDGEVNELDAWLELYNAGKTAVDLSGWSLQAGLTAYQLPAGTILQSRSFLLLFRGQTGLDLAVPGSELSLHDSSGVRVDSMVLVALLPNASYSRDASGTWHGDWPPSPGRPNQPEGPTDARKIIPQ